VNKLSQIRTIILIWLAWAVILLGRLGKHTLFDRAWTTASTLVMGLLTILLPFDL